MSGSALILTFDRLAGPYAKTAHGLIRGPSRFPVAGVVDHLHAGRDAGVVLDGRARGIPVFASLEAALAALAERPEYLIVGIATSGGVMPPEIRAVLVEAARTGLALVNGLHDLLSDDPAITEAASRSGTRLIDLRRPVPFRELHFWTGELLRVAIPRLAVLGTDCAVGKRTTATLLLEACSRSGIRAQLITTGQTGWLQGHPYGFILDATPNDFVCGELEHAILACAREARPDLMLIEGQSSLRNPSGPCGAELTLSAGARGVILQHAPGRRFFEGWEDWREAEELLVPPLAEEIELLRFYRSEVIGIALNGEGMADDEQRSASAAIARETGLPVALPLLEGVESLLPAIRGYMKLSP